MNGVSKKIFLRFGHVALVALLALCAASAPASAQTVAINPDGVVSSGVATVSGTLTAPPGPLVRVEVQVTQFRHGQVVATGFASVGPMTPDGSTQTWTATPLSSFSFAGFKSGQAQVTVRLVELHLDGEVTLAVAGATVQLHPH